MGRRQASLHKKYTRLNGPCTRHTPNRTSRTRTTQAILKAPPPFRGRCRLPQILARPYPRNSRESPNASGAFRSAWWRPAALPAHAYGPSSSSGGTSGGPLEKPTWFSHQSGYGVGLELNSPCALKELIYPSAYLRQDAKISARRGRSPLDRCSGWNSPPEHDGIGCGPDSRQDAVCELAKYLVELGLCGRLTPGACNGIDMRDQIKGAGVGFRLHLLDVSDG